MQFPYGTAALCIMVLAGLSGVAVVSIDEGTASHRPDLVFATFAKEHAEAYKPVIADFERRKGVKIELQVVEQRALQGRLQSALQVGADVPDMVELLAGTMGIFTRGTVEDVGLIDLTERVRREKLGAALVSSRFGVWSSRGHIFALPHDVHPVMLAYRRDLVEQLGIDVSRLTTWEQFARVGREITKDSNGDGIIDRYMLDLPAEGAWALRLLMLQRGAQLFDASGRAAFDDPVAVDTICWYVRQTQGQSRISFPCGWGQTLAQAMLDGLVLFYLTPDWRTRQFEMDVPNLAGKLALMPLPAWEPNGRRTSTWGGTGLALTKSCRNVELAWELAMLLYYEKEHLGPRFASTNILPPLRNAWTLPEFRQPSAFFSGAKLGADYAALAPDVPEEYNTAYTLVAEGKMSEAFTRVSLYYQAYGDAGLREYAAAELKRCADRVRQLMSRNVFLTEAR
jgi:arabinosaccharide transport system substrate-binding protein